MNIWETAIITNKGIALQAKLHSGTTLSLTRAVAGAGTVLASDLINQTSVTDERHEMSFSTQSYPEEGKCAVPLKLFNTNVTEGFTVRQIGVYAFDPDEGEILYLIAQAIDGEGTAVPSATEMPGYLSVWTFYIQYGQADGVDVTVDPAGSMTSVEVEAIVEGHNKSENPHAGVLATQAHLTEHTDNKQNPHGVTAAQLGLDKVNNTPDTEKHVAYAQRAGSADKAKYGITIRFNGGRTENTDEWTYDGSVARSINITPEKIGAAPASHNHNASEIGSGTLSSDRLPVVPVSKGGTGGATASEAREALGINVNTLNAAPKTHYHSASDINQGTMSSDRLPVVPIAKGGTGASTQAAALAAIAGVTKLPVGTLVAYDNIQDVVTSANDMTTNDFISKLPVDTPVWFTNYANRSFNLSDAPSSNGVFLLFNGGYGLGRVGIWFNLYGGFYVFTNGAWKNLDYDYSNIDLGVGSALTTGKLYFIYE